jgi:hypothetical protein
MPFWATSAFAEVSDKCPTYLSEWDPKKEIWYFPSTFEALLHLLKFSAIYLTATIVIFLFIRHSKRKWIKFIPLAFSLLLISSFIADILPQEEPCSRYFLLKEMTSELYMINMAWDAILILVPLTLFVVLWRKKL